MATRMRSPNYPSTSLREAIDIIGKIFSIERTNAIPREVAALAAGYSGISGRSAKVLADLAMYGLLERAGKSETRVSRRAVEILHPDSPGSKGDAIRDAAYEPELFQRVRERFPDGLPSSAALKSYFLREGFTDAAINQAIRAYLETAEFVEQQNLSESYGKPSQSPTESLEKQLLRGEDATTAPARGTGYQDRHQPPIAPQPGMVTGFDWETKRIIISKAITSRAEAKDLINFIQAMVQLLPEESEKPGATATKEEDSNAPL